MGFNQDSAKALHERASVTETKFVPFVQSKDEINAVDTTVFTAMRFENRELVGDIVESGVATALYSGENIGDFLALQLPLQNQTLLPDLITPLPENPGAEHGIWVRIQTDLLSEGHSWKHTDSLIAFVTSLPTGYRFLGIASDSKLADFAKTEADFDGAYSDMITVMDHVRERLVLADLPDTQIMVMDAHTPRTQHAFVGINVLSPRTF